MAAMRACLGDRGRGCPTGSLIPRGTSRCTECARVVEQGRGTRQERGYTAEYDAQRADWKRRIDGGELVECWRCEIVIAGPFHLGHCDIDRSVIHGPEHGPCNTATSGRIGCSHPSHN